MNLLSLLELEQPSSLVLERGSSWFPGIQTWTRTYIIVCPTPILRPLDLN